MKRIAIVLSVLSTPALAEPSAGEPTTPAPYHLDVEVDPTAYAFSGYSVHVGLGYRRVRLDLGIYAMDLPRFFHGNDGWDAAFHGAGAKVQWFPLAEQRGLFVDVSGGVSRERVTLEATGASRTDSVFGIGIDAGWRFALPYNFHVTPWAGVSYGIDADDVMLDGETFAKRKLVPFAAVHVGYRFR